MTARAWLLSMMVPGLGHLYCGMKLRGALVLSFSLAGMWAFWSSIATLVALLELAGLAAAALDVGQA